MAEVQDRALEILRANRGFRSPMQTDDFLQTRNTVITYNGAGDMDTMTITKEISGNPSTKTYTFGYTDGKLTSITQAIL